MEDPGKRLKILTSNEIEELYGLPSFSNRDRAVYFSLDSLEKNELNYYRSIQTKVYFILQLGYFKAKRMFFTFDCLEVQEDIQYIFHQYFFEENDKLTNLEISKPTRLAQQNHILKLLNYQICTKEIKERLQEKAYSIVVIYTKPIYIFKELLNYLENNRIVIPGYSIMQLVVGKAITYEKNRLEAAVQQDINKDSQKALDKLLTAEDSLYELTFLKREPRDFSYKEITIEVNKGESLKELYHLACDFLPKLEISNENIKYLCLSCWVLHNL